MRTRPLPMLLGVALLLGASTASAQPAPSPPRTHRNVGMMIAGIVVASIGGIFVAGGTVALTAGCANQACSEGGGGVLAGAILLALAPVHLGVGIPLAVVGSLPPKSPVASQIPPWAAREPQPRAIGLEWAF